MPYLPLTLGFYVASIAPACTSLNTSFFSSETGKVKPTPARAQHFWEGDNRPVVTLTKTVAPSRRASAKALVFVWMDPRVSRGERSTERRNRPMSAQHQQTSAQAYLMRGGASGGMRSPSGASLQHPSRRANAVTQFRNRVSRDPTWAGVLAAFVWRAFVIKSVTNVSENVTKRAAADRRVCAAA